MALEIETRKIEKGLYQIFYWDLERQLFAQTGGTVKRITSKRWECKFFDFHLFYAPSKKQCENWCYKALEEKLNGGVSAIIKRDTSDLPKPSQLLLDRRSQELLDNIESVQGEIVDPKPVAIVKRQPTTIVDQRTQLEPGSLVRVWGETAIILCFKHLKPQTEPSHAKVKYLSSGRTAEPLLANCQPIG